MATELWRWQGGTSAIDHAYAIDIGEDGSVILGGMTQGDWSGSNSGDSDFMALKLTAEGAEDWTWQEGSTEYDAMNSHKVGDDGSTFAAGGTSGLWGSTTDGEADFAVAKIDSDGGTLWRWQDGTSADDFLISGALLSNGSIIVVGYTYGEWDGEANAGDRDFAAALLDPDGVELWRWMDGTNDTDEAHDVALAEDGSILILGQTFGSYGALNAGGDDAALIKLSADGTILWTWQDGTIMEDYIWELLLAADGSMVLVGYTYGDWDGENAGEADFAAIKLDADGNELWRWQEGTEAEDRIYAGVMTDDGCFFLGGYTEGNWRTDNAGFADSVMVKLDANGTVLWRWQEGNAFTNWITELASRDGKIAVAINVAGDWEGASAGSTDVGVILLESNYSSVNPTPSPTVEHTEVPTTVMTPEPSSAPDPTPSPTVEDTEIPTVVMTAEPFSAPDPTPSPTVEDTEIPTFVMTAEPFSTQDPTPSPLPKPTSSSNDNMIIIAAVAGVGAGLILCATLLFLWRRGKKQPNPRDPAQDPANDPARHPAQESFPEPAPDYDSLFRS